ncbi:protein kinase STUNTED-like isoform X2 [Henckelia pumila]|uniref:protein kinase STUNTED-like isoform X2 n=1 Tax=Henckelia pumila TaxID=405737 RepID=UPI003C6DE630
MDCTNFVESPQAPFSSMTETLSAHADQDYCENLECDETDVKSKSFLYKLIWEFGLGCVIPRPRRLDGENLDGGSCGGSVLENNNAWLLAESGGCGAEEPHSVHSSFRFSICSQVELETMALSNGCSSTTVLMVNLDDGFLNDSKSRELKWRRIQSLERNISPAARSLIRFSYTEILLATRNFSKGKKRGSNSGPVLSWSARYRISAGIAEAIQYLHNGTERCVVHRDIKPSNILVSSKKTPKLCDFGLALWTPAPSVPFLCKTVKGTFGYLAPEYFQHGKVSDKTDIYSFGIVLLELLTGRKPIEMKRGQGEENLVLWAKPLLQQRAFEKFLDPRLKYTRKNMNQISRLVRAANSCLSNEDSGRPEINEIVATLRGRDLTDLKRTKGYSTSNNGLIDGYPQLHRTMNDMTNHIALAMLGVDFDDDSDDNPDYL